MAKDLELSVKGDSKSATAALAAAAHEMDKAAREADKMGRAFDAAKRDAEQLDRELAKNAAAVALLAKEYSSADGEIRDGIKKRLDAEKAAGRELQQVRKDLIGDTERDSKVAAAAFAVATKEWDKLAGKAKKDTRTALDKAGKDAEKLAAKFKALAFDTGSGGAGGLAQSLGKSLAESFSSGAPEIKLAIANVVGAAAVSVAAPVGAAINGAILAGIGLGGIALGIAGQLDNPAVQAAGKQLGADLKKQLTASTAGFERPIVNAAHILDDSLGRTLGNLQDDLDGLATHLEPLARGIGGLFERAFGGKGFADALAAAGPILDEIGAKLPELGQNLDKFFALMADGSAGAKDGIDLLFLATETLIVGIGALIDGLSKLYHAFLAPGREVMSLWDDLRGNTDGYAHSLGGATDATDEFGQSVEQGIGSLADLDAQVKRNATTVDTVWADMVDKVAGSMLSLDRATLGWDESLTKLGESVDKNGKSLSEHTKEGQKNRDAILDGVQANLRLYDAEVASGESAAQAGKEFQAHNDQLRAAAIAAGYNAGEVDKMIQKYGKVPAEIQTQIEMHGLSEAISNLDETIRLVNHLPPRKSVDVDVNVHGNLFAAAGAISKVLGSGYVSSGLGHRATGGPVKAGQAYVVGERRPEVFVPDTDGMIVPSVPAGFGQSGPSVASRWGGTSTGAQAITVTLNLVGSDTAMGTALHGLVRTGVVQFVAVDSSGNRLPVKVA